VLKLLNKQSARVVVIRLLLRLLDTLENNWVVSGVLWSAIGRWLDADPMSHEQFLHLFYEHHRDDPVTLARDWVVGQRE